MSEPMRVVSVCVSNPLDRLVKLYSEPDYTWQGAYDALMAVPHAFRDKASVSCFFAYYERPETADEAKTREKREQNRKDNEARQERKLLAKLLAKHPDVKPSRRKDLKP